MALPSSLDVNRLLLAHSTLSAVTAAGSSPSYNLPIALYGLLVVDKDPESLRTFAILHLLSFVLDIIWLTNYASYSSSFALFLVVINFVLKPVTFLAVLANLKQRNEPALPSSFGNQQVWSMPGGYNAQAQASAPYQSFSEAPEDEEPQAAARSAGQSASKPQAAQGSPAKPAGGYHSIGDD
ncbi:uncharacterized protein L969DRAFT_55320 [Mixia osmundae IAM 14324]|uniref:Uncharacterized protein n=1 Tax=Mixia osmundae (strain CBS 9802 / IAM 14324 / JCM 22182 / KY 12970) TaxID=764103 RepID=G7E4G5_MIXOS|nr:uncharacterized protein L969DRAFT_55320 [Mixia osmundae IAM 14324]KEI36258.1 hypothetical protein L969DRAFT_55320 [Mixia osmundae IAM 14324]GAA97725.1 hypothetical protein E5Q_04404 [Mixia osmundae IAM 14324]